MINVLRDYGAINGSSYPENSFDIEPRRQVFLATHGEDGKRLPYMNRSFISFSYGGKWIEEFDLIAITKGDRMLKNGYTSFEDITSVYENLDGQYYWNTHYRTNTLTFNLATDGIDLRMLDEFLLWFKPGEQKELILAEHPNRAQLARVSVPPDLQLLPFEENVVMTISGSSYDVKTTLYKGEIILTLILDEPHWYAKTNILGMVSGNHYIDKWKDANGVTVNIDESPDALKILYEDGIPLGSMIESNMFLGGGIYATAENPPYSLIFNTTTNVGARIDGTVNGVVYRGVIAGASVSVGNAGIISDLSYEDEGNFFYAGTAPAYTTIEFDLTPALGAESNVYCAVVSPLNKYTNLYNNFGEYNTFTITSNSSLVLKFTTPNILTSYNEVIRIFDEMIATGNIWEDVYANIRDNVRHAAVRAWASAVIRFYGETTSPDLISSAVSKDTMKLYMSYFLCNKSGLVQPIHFIFNSETGEAIGTFKYRAPTSQKTWGENDEWLTWGTIKTKKEDVGDMLYSNYIIIKERNYPTSEGRITKWVDTNSVTKAYSHKFNHDVATGLLNIKISYKTMYL